MNKKITPEIIEKILEVIKLEVRPALGCTEPISTALASAIVREYLGKIPDTLQIYVSGNLFKNAMAVSVPHTQMQGLPIAAAMGLACGDSKLKLEVLRNATNKDLELAKTLIPKIHIKIQENTPSIYIQAIGKVNHPLPSKYKTISVTIAHEHTHIQEITGDSQTLLYNPFNTQESHQKIFENLLLEDIYEIACEIQEDKIAFIAESDRLNSALSDEGLKKNYGLGIGKTFLKHMENGLSANDLQNKILIYTTAASDARMGGANLPAMSNSGSGNQGITATMPVVITAKHLKKEHLLNRALFLSHLVAIYIHSKLPRLSSLCAVTTAGIGSYAGIAWLFTQDFKTISHGISSMIGDISGILCDGAANSCSMKVATTIQSAYKSLLLALDKSYVTGNEGIVADDVNESIQNLCDIANQSLKSADKQILEIMIKKYEHKLQNQEKS